MPLPDSARWLELWREHGDRCALPFRVMWDARTIAERYGQRTPSDVIYTENKLRVLRYRPRVEKPNAVPLVMIAPIIMPYYIMDLKPGKSLVEYLIGRGLDVFMIDWGVPDARDRFDTLDDYIVRYLKHAVDAVCRLTHQSQVTLHGYCQGGLLAILFAVLFPKRVRNLVSQAGPVNFHDDGIFSLWTRNLNADLMVDTLGNISAEILWATFQSVNWVGAISQTLQFYQRADDREYVDDFLAMNTWLNHTVPFPGEVFRKFIKDLYQKNLLVRGEFEIAHTKIALNKITCPVLTITTKKDHIVPWQSAAALNDLVGSADKELLLMQGGHLGMTVGRGARDELWLRFADWVIARSKTTRRAAPHR